MSQKACPNCAVELKRDYGIPAEKYFCPKCLKEWILCLGRLISREEFHSTADQWHY